MSHSGSLLFRVHGINKKVALRSEDTHKVTVVGVPSFPLAQLEIQSTCRKCKVSSHCGETRESIGRDGCGGAHDGG